MTGLTAEWPLVGREGELRLLTALLARPEPGGVVLVGPPGVGKTRLATEGLALAEAAGLPVARVTATRAAARLPLGALTPLLRAGDEEPVFQAQLLRRAAAALAERAGERRLVLLVDNVNLLDDVSAALVHQLAVTGSVFLLLTLQPLEPVSQTVAALWTDGFIERLQVQGLDGAAIDQLLNRVLGGTTDRAAVARLAARSHGSLLFLRELVLTAVQSGSLVEIGGLWQLVRPLTPSPRIVDLVEARLAGLSSHERAVLEAVAVGEPVGVAELSEFSDLASVESLEAQGLLAVDHAGRRRMFRVGHPLYGDVLRKGTSGLRRHSIVRTLAEAVEGVGGRRADDLLRTTAWRLDGGGASVDRLHAAAVAARGSFDLHLAQRLARAAATGGSFAAQVLAAQLASLLGEGAEAEAELAALVPTNDVERSSLSLARIDNLQLLARFDDALTVAEKAEADLGTRSQLDEIASRRALCLLEQRGPAAAIEVSEPLRNHATGGALARSCLVSAFALTRSGQLTQAEEAVIEGEAASIAAPAGTSLSTSLFTVARAEVWCTAGRLAQGEAVALDEYRKGVASGRIDVQSSLAWQLTKVTLAQGRVETAVRYGREAVALLRSLGRWALIRHALVSLALAQGHARQAGPAARTLQELEELGFPATRWTGCDQLSARAWAEVAAGDLPAARSHLEQAATFGEDTGDHLGRVTALHDLARLGRAKEVEGRLAATVAGVEGELSAVRLAHVQALASGDAAALEAVGGRFEGLGSWLFAAEATADAAVSWRRAGNAKAAKAAAAAAEGRAARCEGAVTPALSALEARAVLSPAEREAAYLCAAGRSNREIASDLGLSVRTVENRLQRIYEKLAVSGRSELAATLQR